MNIGIIGQGLMGGSIQKGIEGSFFCTENDFEKADVLILAVPISAILEIGEKIFLSKREKPLLVLDIGSVKGVIAKAFETWTQGAVEFVATHPMAGKEKSGIEHSDPGIFQDAVWVVTPHANNTKEALKRIEELIEGLGSRPLRLDAEIHDRQAAYVSQLPYLLSKALDKIVDEESRKMAGPGFQSMIRLAGENSEMREEIAKYNQQNIERALRETIEILKNS